MGLEEEEAEQHGSGSHRPAGPQPAGNSNSASAAAKPPAPSAQRTGWSPDPARAVRSHPHDSTGSRHNRADCARFMEETLREEVKHLIYIFTALNSEESPSTDTIPPSATCGQRQHESRPLSPRAELLGHHSGGLSEGRTWPCAGPVPWGLPVPSLPTCLLTRGRRLAPELRPSLSSLHTPEHCAPVLASWPPALPPAW